jgi:hypothetical protein
MKKSVIALALMVALAAQAAPHPTVEDVGDADSFGRDVIYLGNAQTGNVTLQADCTPDPVNPLPPTDRCVVLNAQPAPTNWSEDGLATMKLPAEATKSLICFTLTPNAFFQFNNLTGVQQPNARFNAGAVITIQNAVLDDPTLIDRGTGLPYGGKIVFSLSTYSESRSIAAGERAQKNLFLSRTCIAGLVSKRSLTEGFGFTEAQAKQFFKNPMTLTFGSRGQTQMVDFSNFFYGIRLYGDSKDK